LNTDFEMVEKWKAGWLFPKLTVEMPDGSYQPYKPHKGQAPIHYTDSRFFWARAAQRAGKTLPLAAEHTAELGMKRHRSWLVAPTYDLVDRCFENVWRWVVEEKVHGPDSLNANRCSNTRDRRYIQMKDGAFLLGKSAENPKSLVGEQLDFLGMDECRYFSSNLWGDKLRPRLVTRQGRALGITSPGGYDWFEKFYEYGQSPEGQADGWHSVHYTLYDNPYVERAEIAEMKRSMSEDQFNQEVLGLPVHFTGLVWPDFRDALYPHGHLYDPKNPDFQFEPHQVTGYRAVDPGYFNPTACLFGDVDRDRNLYVRDEYEEKLLPHEDQAKNIVAQTRGDVFVTLMPKDARKRNPQTESDQKTTWETYRRNGIYCREAFTDNEAGFSNVARYFRATLETSPDHPRIFISKDCTKLRRAILEYVREDGSQKRDTDGPEKAKKRNDHLPDALRYLCSARLVHVNKTLRTMPAQILEPPKRAWTGAARIA
jgi:hypothetical protein